MHTIVTSAFGSIELFPDSGRDYQGPTLPDSELQKAEGNFGIVFFQSVISEKFTASFYHTRFRKRTTIALPIMKGLIHCIFCLKGNEIRQVFKARIKINSDQYSFIPSSSTDIPLLMEKDVECWNLIVSYHVSELESVAIYFPVVSNLLNAVESTDIFERSVWMDKAISGLIEQLLHLNMEPSLSTFLFREWVDDLLYRALLEFEKAPVRLRHLSAVDADKIYQARRFILDDLKMHHSIDELSRKVGLNDFKIKEGFRQLFGKGPFALLKDARMELAYELMLHTHRPEKDIMTDAGYTSLTAFVKAFRSVYGIPPGHLRHQHRADE